jgi:ABC-type multidrug transport system ATPase subunit
VIEKKMGGGRRERERRNGGREGEKERDESGGGQKKTMCIFFPSPSRYAHLTLPLPPLCFCPVLFFLAMMFSEQRRLIEAKRANEHGISVVLNNVEVRLSGQTLLSKVCCKFDRCRTYALLGESGSGKSTLLKTIAGMYSVRRGSVEWYNGGRRMFDGTQDTIDMERWRMSVVYVPKNHHPFVVLGLKSAECIAFALRMRTHTPSATIVVTRVNKLLERFGLSGLANQNCSLLSDGQTALLTLACACVGKPGLVLADEPLGALDIISASKVRSEFLRMARHGATVVCSVHQPGKAALKDFHGAAIMRAGRMRHWSCPRRGPSESVDSLEDFFYSSHNNVDPPKDDDVDFNLHINVGSTSRMGLDMEREEGKEMREKGNDDENDENDDNNNNNDNDDDYDYDDASTFSKCCYLSHRNVLASVRGEKTVWRCMLAVALALQLVLLVFSERWHCRSNPPGEATEWVEQIKVYEFTMFLAASVWLSCPAYEAAFSTRYRWELDHLEMDTGAFGPVSTVTSEMLTGFCTDMRLVGVYTLVLWLSTSSVGMPPDLERVLHSAWIALITWLGLLLLASLGRAVGSATATAIACAGHGPDIAGDALTQWMFVCWTLPGANGSGSLRRLSPVWLVRDMLVELRIVSHRVFSCQACEGSASSLSLRETMWPCLDDETHISIQDVLDRVGWWSKWNISWTLLCLFVLVVLARLSELICLRLSRYMRSRPWKQ